MITAKVALAVKTMYPGTTKLEFLPDYADGRNKEWAASTPSLNLAMTVTPEIGERFQAGKKYTLMFEETSD